MIIIATDMWKGKDRRRHSVSRFCVKCDDCGAVSQPECADYYFGQAMHWAACKHRGWTERLRGRLQQHICPTCSGTRHRAADYHVTEPAEVER